MREFTDINLIIMNPHVKCYYNLEQGPSYQWLGLKREEPPHDSRRRGY